MKDGGLGGEHSVGFSATPIVSNMGVNSRRGRGHGLFLSRGIGKEILNKRKARQRKKEHPKRSVG